MSFTLIGTDKDNSTVPLELSTPSGSAIGDMEIIIVGVDSPTSVDDELVDTDGFTRAHARIDHASDTLNIEFFFRVVTVAGVVNREVAGFGGSSAQGILAVFRNDTGGGTWDIVTPVSDNTETDGDVTVGPVTSEDDSLLIFNAVNDSQSTVTTAPSGMTETESFSDVSAMATFTYHEDIATGASESRSIDFSATDAVIGVIAVFTYTIEAGAGNPWNYYAQQ